MKNFGWLKFHFESASDFGRILHFNSISMKNYFTPVKDFNFINFHFNSKKNSIGRDFQIRPNFLNLKKKLDRDFRNSKKKLNFTKELTNRTFLQVNFFPNAENLN